MHYHQRHAEMRRCAAAIQVAIRRVGGMPLWPRIAGGNRRRRRLMLDVVPCAIPGCGVIRELEATRDARGLYWCADHLEGPLPRGLLREPARRRLVVTRGSAGELDSPNFVGGCKGLIDACVNEGLLYDDRPAWLEDHYRQEKAPRGEGYTEIEISEVVP